MMIDAVNPDNLWSPFGAFSMAVIQGDGQIVHLKGQVSLDRSGDIVGPNDMRIQVRKVLENIREMLISMGGYMSDVMSLVHYTTDIQSFMMTGDIRQDFFKPPYPVTTTVEVRQLFRSELVIEIAAIAEIPLARLKRPRSSV